MAEDIYKKLANVLDTLPNGYPATESGIELKILKKIFEPDEADLFCDLKLSFETPEQISRRTGRSLDGLSGKLTTMWHKGQIFGVDFGTAKLFKMMPWVFGIYEFQLKHLTREFVEMVEEYMPYFGMQFFSNKPQLMHIVPVEQELKNSQEAMPYERVSSIIEKGLSFAVNDCICKKEKELLGEACDRPMEVCLAIAPVPGIFDNHPFGAKPITKEEAYEVLRKSEEAGLVHMTSNFQNGHIYICNCCSCCCGVLRAINEYGISEGVNSSYIAQIETDTCVGCGICADERCQVHAIEEDDGAYVVLKDRCIGCGLCISTCQVEAISLVRKNPEDIVKPPVDEMDWYKKRSEIRGVDAGTYM
ncbi:MAG: 4Fe-4S binding protein [Proteobacteria bacterium]|nr:4Fe-4S binding protein [Pseudomonadota bacterium]